MLLPRLRIGTYICILAGIDQVRIRHDLSQGSLHARRNADCLHMHQASEYDQAPALGCYQDIQLFAKGQLCRHPVITIAQGLCRTCHCHECELSANTG